MLERHFTPGNDTRYRFEPRNKLYMDQIKRMEGVSQGRFVKEILKGQALRWLRTFAVITGTQTQATIRMTAPTYFEHPFVGSSIDPQSGRLKHCSHQPDKPAEVTQVNEYDREKLKQFAIADLSRRIDQAFWLKQNGL